MEVLDGSVISHLLGGPSKTFSLSCGTKMEIVSVSGDLVFPQSENLSLPVRRDLLL